MFVGDQPSTASNSGSTSFVFPGSASNTNPFVTSSTGGMLCGSQSSSSMQSNFSASPAFGSSTSSTSTVCFPTFVTPPFPSGFSFINNNSGSLFQQTQSSSANQISGSSTVFGPSTQSTFGNNSSPFSTMHNSVTPSSGFTSCPTFTFPPSLTTFKFEKSDGHDSLNSKPIFGQPNPAICTSGELGTRSFSSGSSFFNNSSGSLFQQTQSSSANQISGSSTAFGPSTQSTIGNNSSPFSTMNNSVTPSSGFTSHPIFSFPPSTTFNFKKPDGQESLNSKHIFGHPDSAIGTNGEVGTRSFSSGSSFFNGSLCQQTQSLPANQIYGSSTVFGSSTSTFGNNGALSSSMHNSVTPFSGFTGPAVSFASAPSFTTFQFGKTDGHESLDTQSILSQLNSVINTNRELGTRSISSGFCPSATKSQCQGSVVASYVATPEVNDTVTAQTSCKIVSISAMPTYKDKSHEELRLEDYQLLREKGSSVFNKNPGSLFPQTTSTSANHISGLSTAFGPSSQSTFFNSNSLVSGEGNSVSHGCKCSENSGSFLTPSFQFIVLAFSSYGTVSAFRGPWNMTSMVSNQEFGPSAIQCQWQGSRVTPYAATPESWVNVTAPTSAKIVSVSAMPAYERKSHEELKFEDYLLTRGKGYCISENRFEDGLSKSTTRNLASGTTSGFSSGVNNIISPKVQFLEPSGGTANALSESTLAQNKPDMVRHTSTGLGHQPGIDPISKVELTFTSNSSPTIISNQPSSDPNAGAGSLKINVEECAAQSNPTIGWSPVTNPFGGEPTAQISVDCPVTIAQHGTSSLSITGNPSTVGRMDRLTVSQRLSSNRKRITVVKYKLERDHKKVPFFEEGLPDVCKFKAPFIPRENPRAWLLRPTEEDSRETKTSKSSMLEDKASGISNEASKEKEGGTSPQFIFSLNGMFDSDSCQQGEMHIISQGHQEDEDATVYVHGADVQRIMPKLQCPEYYTIPSIEMLAAKEKNEPGFCCHVKDFVVGRYGYGSIKFLGETDVRNLNLESIVKFNHCEVIVYMDDTKKPPVGQGLNKPAEITLLNVKCVDKNTERLHVDGPMVDKYKRALIKKGAEKGAEFVSYDPASGEWKFKVLHF